MNVYGRRLLIFNVERYDVAIRNLNTAPAQRMVVRASALVAGGRGSIPDRVTPKT